MTSEDEARVREIVTEMLAKYDAKLVNAFRDGLKPIQPNEVRVR